MRILNLYAGIGGNRKLWGDDHNITAVELEPKIAKIYQDFFPKDKVIVADAHQFLLEHFKEYDFIWSSPPCPSHSRLRKGFSVSVGAKPIFPDMKLYEEIIFLQGYSKRKYVVESVVSWYEPLIIPIKLSRHYYWANFFISNKTRTEDTKIKDLTGGKFSQTDEQQILQLENGLGFNLYKYKLSKKDRRTYLRNCVEPELGLHILKESQREEYSELF